MKIVRRKKVKTVQAKSANAFDRKFNEASEGLEDYEIVWDTAPMCVHFLYEEVTKIAESTKEEYEEILGEHYYCKDCPYAKKGKDKRNGIQGCSKNVSVAKDFTPACELFYKELALGKIKGVRA